MHFKKCTKAYLQTPHVSFRETQIIQQLQLQTLSKLTASRQYPKKSNMLVHHAAQRVIPAVLQLNSELTNLQQLFLLREL